MHLVGTDGQLWQKQAPGFNLDCVTAPLRLEAIGLGTVLEEHSHRLRARAAHRPGTESRLPPL
jgi:hypothetical protein